MYMYIFIYIDIVKSRLFIALCNPPEICRVWRAWINARASHTKLFTILVPPLPPPSPDATILSYFDGRERGGANCNIL